MRWRSIDNVCKRPLFSIPSKVEMAEEQKYLWYYFWMLSLLIETCVGVFRLILCAIWFTALVKCKSFLWSGKRIYGHAHKRACLLRVVCYKFKRSFTWIINLCAHLLFLFTSWMVHKFFIWASTDPWTNIFNSCIVWLLSTTTGSLTANWIISIVDNCNADISSKVKSFSRASFLILHVCICISVIDFDAGGLNARLFGHYAGEILKRRLHSEKTLIVFYPYDFRGISKRTIKLLVTVSVGIALEENSIGFEKLGFQNVFLATRKRKAGVFKSSSGLRSPVFVTD